MKKLILTSVLGLGAASLFGGAAVDAMTTSPNVLMTSLSARQRYPWNGKVDIDFTFTCDIPEAFAFVNFKAAYVDKNGVTNTVPMKTFDQFTTAFCTNAGTYRVTWDSVADAPGLRVTNLQYTVTANLAKYMVVDLSGGSTATKYPISYYEDVPSFPGVSAGKWDDYHKTTNLVLRLVQPGTYRQAWSDERSNYHKLAYAHTAVITRPFYLAVFELTQEQMYLMENNYGFGTSGGSQLFTGGNRKCRPSANTYQNFRGQGYNGKINWPVTGSEVGKDTIIGRFRAKTNEGFDLPTLSEWEYACRCGTRATGFWNDGSDAGILTSTSIDSIEDGNAALESLGRYRFNGGRVKTEKAGGGYDFTEPAADCDETSGTAVVGSYLPNEWGFYDMHGNVAELVLDAWSNVWSHWGSKTIYTDDVGITIDPFGQWEYRFVCGGNYSSAAKQCVQGNYNSVEERQPNGIRLCWHFSYPAKTN